MKLQDIVDAAARNLVVALDEFLVTPTSVCVARLAGCIAEYRDAVNTAEDYASGWSQKEGAGNEDFITPPSLDDLCRHPRACCCITCVYYAEQTLSAARQEERG